MENDLLLSPSHINSTNAMQQIDQKLLNLPVGKIHLETLQILGHLNEIVGNL